VGTILEHFVGDEIRGNTQARPQERRALADQWRMPDEPPPEMLRDRLIRIQEAFGGELGLHGGERTFTTDELQIAGKWIRARCEVDRGSRAARYGLQSLSDRLGTAQDAIEALAEIEQAMSELLRTP
jgi:hypothetical protein